MEILHKAAAENLAEAPCVYYLTPDSKQRRLLSVKVDVVCLWACGNTNIAFFFLGVSKYIHVFCLSLAECCDQKIRPIVSGTKEGGGLRHAVVSLKPALLMSWTQIALKSEALIRGSHLSATPVTFPQKQPFSCQGLANVCHFA